MTPTARTVLLMIALKQEELDATPDPPAHRRWDVEEMQEQRRCGPRYSTSDWFGDGVGVGLGVPDRVRMRYTRAVHWLENAGLIEGTNSEGGRLKYMKLTDAGRAALATDPAQAADPVFA